MTQLGALVPDVLRTGREFRLLFAGQVLSPLGDRVMLVALPFGVLEACGGVREVGRVVQAVAGALLATGAPAVAFAEVAGP